MSPAPPIDPLAQTTVGALLRTAYVFEIPLNQRPLKWGFKKMESVWLDLRDATDEHLEHFLGFMVFQEAGSSNKPIYVVQDGQQRLMCLMSICSILRDHAAEDQKATLLTWINPNGKPRIRLDVHHKHLTELFTGASPIVPSNQRLSARKFITSYGRLKDEINRFFSPMSPEDRHRWVKNFIDVLDDKTFITCVSVRDQSLALKVFYRLNSGGVPLSPADEVKNIFYMKAERRRVSEKVVSKRWDKIIDAVPFADLTTFLRYWTMVQYGRTVRNRDLADEFRKTIDKTTITDVLDLMLQDAENLQGWWKVHVPTGQQDVSDALWLLGQPQLGYPLLWLTTRLHADGQITKADSERFAVALERYIFRELVVRKRKTNEIEQHLAQASDELRNGNVGSAIAFLASKSPDAEFKQVFAHWSVRTNKKQFYTLRAIERLLGSSPGASYRWSDKGTRDWEIEHIHPQALEESLGVELNRLGNLVLLEKSINKAAGRLPFSDKTQIYEHGDLSKRKAVPLSKMSAAVGPVPPGYDYKPVIYYSQWTDSEVEERQEQLAELAVEIWKIDT